MKALASQQSGMAIKDEVWEFKRDRILDEAVPLFAEHGFQGVSIDQIAKKLKVTKPFIYTYFRNKDALLEEIFARAAQNLLNGFDEFFADDRLPHEKLAAFVEYYVIENIKRADITAIFLNEEKNLSPASRKRLRAHHHEFDRKLAQLINEGVKAGVFEADDPMLESLAISGMVRWVHRWHNPEGRLQPEQIAQKMSAFALRIVGYKEAPKKARSAGGRRKAASAR